MYFRTVTESLYNILSKYTTQVQQQLIHIFIYPQYGIGIFYLFYINNKPKNNLSKIII